jgi:excisionase family DNA binding protein
MREWTLTKEVNKKTMEQNNYIHFPLMTVGEAAKYLGVGRKVIYQLIEFDQIQSVRENRAVLIEKRSLDSFRQSGTLT